MGINYYGTKYQDRIKDLLKANGYPELKNIPIGAFKQAMMIVLGMSEKGADKWLSNFETVGIVKCTHIDECNWKVDYI